MKAVVVNLVVAGLPFLVSILHLIHGGGWKSGAIELVFAVLLVTAANMVHRAGNTEKLSRNTSMTGQQELGRSDWASH